MPSAGDYQFYRNHYTDKTVDLDILTGTASYANVIAPKTANHAVYIQRITLSITTHVDDTYLFDDDGAGPPIAQLLDEATVVPTVPSSWTWDFGPKGRKLTTGANLDVSHSSTGVAVAHIEAYEKLENVIAYDSGASNQ